MVAKADTNVKWIGIYSHMGEIEGDVIQILALRLPVGNVPPI